MAYAAFSRVDPRLLAQDFGADKSAAIGAVGDTIKALGGIAADTITEIDKKKKEEDDLAFLQFQRTQEVQRAYDSNQEQIALYEGTRFEPGEFTPPPGYTIENGRAILETEVNNLADGITGKRRERRKKRNQKRIAKGKDPLAYKQGDVILDSQGNEVIEVTPTNNVEETEEETKPAIYNDINGAFPGSNFGGGYRSKKEALTAKDSLASATSGLNEVSGAITNITSSPNYDAAANPMLTSFQTASDNNAVHTMYDSASKNTYYVWQGKDGSYHRVNASNVITRNGQLNVGAFTGGKEVQGRVTNSSVTDGLLAKKALQPIFTKLNNGQYVPPAQVAVIENTLTNEFTSNPDMLASYIRNNEVVDPTPDDGEITAADAAAFHMGTLRGNPLFETGFNAPPPTVTNTTDTIKGLYGNIVTSYKAKDATFFESLGLKGARFVGDTLTYEDDKGKTQVLRPSQLESLLQPLILRNYGSGRERTNLLNAYPSILQGIREENEVKLEEARATKKAEQTNRVLGYNVRQLKTQLDAAVGEDAKMDATILEGMGPKDNPIKTIKKDKYGDEFTVTFDDGSTLRVNPDNDSDVNKLYNVLQQTPAGETPTTTTTTEIPEAHPELEDLVI